MGERLNLPFPLIADVDGSLYRRFQVGASALGAVSLEVWRTWRRSRAMGIASGGEQPMEPLRLPADFLIAGDGRIARAHYGRHYADHLPLEEACRALDPLSQFKPSSAWNVLR